MRKSTNISCNIPWNINSILAMDSSLSKWTILRCMGLKSSIQLLVSFSALDMNLKQFRVSKFGGLSSLMVRDDIGQLVLGARGRVLTLSLDDITRSTSEVRVCFRTTLTATCYECEGIYLSVFTCWKTAPSTPVTFSPAVYARVLLWVIIII